MNPLPSPHSIKAEPADIMLNVSCSALGKKWVHRRYNDHDVELMCQQYGVSRPVAEILSARAISPQDVPAYLNPSLRNELPDPLILKDMQKAIDRIVLAFENNQKIGVFGDYDVDGTTSAALLTRYFQALNIPHEVHLPDRFTEGYGPNANAFSQLKENGADLCLTVDCGATAHSVLAQAAEIGLEIIVVDHHQMSLEMPEAIAVINPNRPDDLSGLENLSAVGVTFMLLVGLNRQLRQNGYFETVPEPKLVEWLDIVALGLVCDVMTLSGLTRVLVSQGLKTIGSFDGNETFLLSYPGVKALGQVASATGSASAYHLGFTLGPRINAAGRIGHANTALKLLTTSNFDEARHFAEKLQILNQERQAIEADVLNEAVAFIEKSQSDHSKALIAYHEGWHQGVIGIVAARLKEKYDKPAFVFSVENGVGKASARSIQGIDLGLLVRQAIEKGLLLSGGGHEMAAGMSINLDQMDHFNSFVQSWILENARESDAARTLRCDGLVGVQAITKQTADEIATAGPFGTGNPEPRFVLERVKVVFSDIKGANHVAVTLANELGQRARGISFRAGDTPLGELLMAADKPYLHIAGKIKADDWRGGGAGQLIIDDAAKA